jgi:nucleotide-binding universal stress UspA family protein
MLNLDKIMVAFDLSDYSVKAFKYGCELAEEMKADLIIANVINQRDVNAVELTQQVSERISVENYIAEQKQYRSTEIEKMMAAKYCNIPSVSIIFKIGVPSQELLKIIGQEKPAIVVMGTKGRGNIAGVLFGSTAEKMFRHCPVPLLSVREKQ